MHKLTELEGAVVGAISRNPHCTAYQVRKEFLDSPSVEWSGSAGAVYPALKRLAETGLVRRTEAARGESLSLTAAGERALETWVLDAGRAAGPGIDPFRTRAGFVAALPAAQRKKCVKALRAQIETQQLAVRALMPDADRMERASLELTLDLQNARLKWLARVSPP